LTEAALAPADVAVVHLVWAPLGVGMLEGFLDAYARHPAGIEHRLAIVLNGFDGPGDPRLAEVERALEGVDHRSIVTPETMLDLGAYRHAAEQLGAHELCFLNSYSRPLVAGWLAKLVSALRAPGVGMAGCSASNESAYSSAPFWLRHWRRQFPPFPNPSLRTNGFVIERDLFLAVDWPAFDSKLATLVFESGRNSLSQQVRDRGLELVVVGRDGIAYPQERWRESDTFRSGAQRNLLVEDNRTRQFEDADGAFRRRLREMAWGP
jgi:hypothetical protein